MGVIESCILKQSRLEDFPNELITGRRLAKVVEVYDGDTVTVILFCGIRRVKQKVRIYGLDTPEIRPLKSIENREDEIKRAKAAREFLKQLVLNKVVVLDIMGREKYGRFLCSIHVNIGCSHLNVEQTMIEEGHGTPYFGGKKKKS